MGRPWRRYRDWRARNRAVSERYIRSPGRVGGQGRLPDGVAHTYVATTRLAALLEPAFHEASPPSPRIYQAQLALWLERAVT